MYAAIPHHIFARMSPKELERWYVELARRAGGALPNGDLTAAESPDFLLAAADGSVAGIEVTRFSRQRSRAEIAHEEARLQSARRVRRAVLKPRPAATCDDLAAVIGRKEARLAAYHAKATAVWLLIVFGAFSTRSRSRITEDALEAPFVTSFAGIVLYDVLDDLAWTITADVEYR